MSEEINDSGLTSDAPATEPEIENPEDNVVPHKVDDEQENVSEAKETKTDAAEKPEWLEDKFWDKENGEVKTEDLNKSFSELQKQFSMGKHKAPKEYDLEVLEDVDVENDELSQFFLDWTNKYKPTQGAFNELVTKFKELSVAQELGSNRGNWSASTAYAVRDIVKDTSTNNIFMAKTAHTSSGSQPLTTNTDRKKL